jgi:hypothetical protein
MFRSFSVAAIAVFCSAYSFAQASLATLGTPYTQDFSALTGGTDGSTYSWTNNSTLTGWYIDESSGDDLPVLEATIATPNNTGSAYIIRSGADQSLGSRASGGTGTIYYGVRLVNNTGSSITSLYIDYYGEQWSIAENNSNVNTITVDYQVGATVTSLTSGTWTNVPALSFTQLWNSTQSSGLGGSACSGTSNQCLGLDGNASANRTHITACVTVSIPAGSEIMIRWVDIDNSANDHHMQIDDLSIFPFNVSCATVLPVELTAFKCEKSGDDVRLNWTTASEKDNDYFSVERSDDGMNYTVIGQVAGHGNSTQPQHYQFTDRSPEPGIYYYRLKQVDFNGRFEYSPIRAITILPEDKLTLALEILPEEWQFSFTGTALNSRLEIYSATGALVYAEDVSKKTNAAVIRPSAHGLYFIRLISGEKLVTEKIMN